MTKKELQKILQVIREVTSDVPKEQDTPFGKYFVKTINRDDAYLIEPIWHASVTYTINIGKTQFNYDRQAGGPILFLDNDVAEMCFYDLEHYEEFCIYIRWVRVYLNMFYKKIKYADLADRTIEVAY